VEEGGIVSEKTEGPAKPEESKETRADLKRKLKDIADKLNRLEGQKRSGARERLPKGRMLDARPLEEKDREHYYRYENTDDAGRMQTMVDDGFVAVPEKEAEDAGVRAQVGELRLIRQPMEKRVEEVERQKELARSRLEAHKQDMQKAAEGVAKELRDRYGYSISAEDILVNE
jgi:hypothetical protein